jgi:hypothetical protein
MILKKVRPFFREKSKGKFRKKNCDCGTEIVPQSFCNRSAIITEIVAEIVAFTEGVKFCLFSTQMTSAMPQKQKCSTALKMTFMTLFDFPDFEYFFSHFGDQI